MKTLISSCIIMLMFVAPQMQYKTYGQNRYSAQKIIMDDVDAKNEEFSYLYNEQEGSDNLYKDWVNFYASRNLPDDNITVGMALDPEGNVYVAGYFQNSYLGYDYFIVKFATKLGRIWSAQYNGTGNEDDCANAVCVDDFGNSYVTGKSYSSNNSYDYVTVKYNPDGIRSWAICFNGQEKNNIYFNDEATAITVDRQRNVYVTGKSYNLDSSYDYVTIKYCRCGIEQWVVSYNGSGNSDDIPTAIVADDSANIYITGLSKGIQTYYDYVTIKYNTTGVQQWVARYKGPIDHDSHPNLAIDNYGNVIVSGTSEDNGTSYDYATVKYNNDGIELWRTIYNGQTNGKDRAAAIAVDDSGNVFVTGQSMGVETGNDYATIKYNAAGSQQWVVRYNGYYDFNDEALALDVDKMGNVFVTGASQNRYEKTYDYTTIKYNLAGMEVWQLRYNMAAGNCDNYPVALKIDSSGNICISGNGMHEGFYHTVTVKYNNDGNMMRKSHYNGAATNVDEAVALVIDDQSNVYVTGSSQDHNEKYNYLTCKYDIYGTHKWKARYYDYYNADCLDSKAKAIAVDKFGNAYVTGKIWRHYPAKDDYATIKYNCYGIQQWVALFSGPDDSYDEPSAIAVDDSGNVYVTGWVKASDNKEDYDYATIKYNNDGEKLWASYYGSPRKGRDEATAMGLDDLGNVYVTGRSYGIATNYDFATIKYNAEGVKQWVGRYNGPGMDADKAVAIAVDRFKNVYVAGWSKGAGTANDFTTIKYDSLGVRQWVARYNSCACGIDEVTALVIDSSGNVYVTGKSYNPNTLYDFVTIKYNTHGLRQWKVSFNSSANRDDIPTAIAIDNSGNIYVTGYSVNSNGNPDFTTVKYDTNGVLCWFIHYDGPGKSRDKALAIAVDNYNNIFVTGTSAGRRRRCWKIYTTIKYVQSSTSGKVMQDSIFTNEITNAKPKNYLLFQNYPNPCNPATAFRYALPKMSHVSLKIFNLLGQEIVTLVNEKQHKGEYEINWDAGLLPGGIYFYRLHAEDLSKNTGKCFVQTKKLILMK